VVTAVRAPRHCHLILPDLRGHGASGRLADPAAYANGRLWADDLAAVLRLAEGAAAVAVAWSFAGRMLLDYVRHHGTVTSVVLLGDGSSRLVSRCWRSRSQMAAWR